MQKFCLFAPIVLCLIFSAHAKPQSGLYTEAALDELRVEIDDLKYALKSTQVELNLLDERIKKQDQPFHAAKTTLSSSLTSQINTFEKKISQLEKTLEKIANDLRTLSNSANQTLSRLQHLEQELLSHENRLNEIAKLKGTLMSISKAIHPKSSNEPLPETKSYRVKAGDSLEKIARHHHISTDALRKINHLSDDKIFVGQELRLPDDTVP